MSILTLQTILARLCVDAPFRQRLLSEPEPPPPTCDLTPQEWEIVRALDRGAIARYAERLIAKQIHRLQKWFPLSFSVLETQLSSEECHDVLSWCAAALLRDSPEWAGGGVRREAEWFCHYLHPVMRRWRKKIPYFTDLLAFERRKWWMRHDESGKRRALAWAEAHRRQELSFTAAFAKDFHPRLGRHVRTYAFRYPLAPLLAWLEGRRPAPPQKEPTWVLFWPDPQIRDVTTYTINPPLKALLDLCDGTRRAAQILSFMGARYAAAWNLTEAELASACQTLWVSLYRKGALTFIRPEADRSPKKGDGERPRL